jgi:RNA polymerase sigma factor (sigma-70 family)
LTDLCVAERAFFLRLAWGILRDAHAAEDACQQAFVQACAASQTWSDPATPSPGCRAEAACEARPAPPDPARLRPWLAQVVVNESLQVLRRRKLERRLRGPSPALDQSGVVADESRAAPDADPFLRETVLAALEQLPEPNRLVVLLRIMEGWSGNEVKDLLGCSAAEVSRRLYRGMEQLRGLLADVGGVGRS